MTTAMKKFWSMWAVITIGLLVTFFLTVKVFTSAVEKDRQAFQKETREQSRVLENYIIESFRVLDSLDAFFQSSQLIERNEFSRFTSHLVKHYPYIQAIEWVPIVKHEQRSLYELKARQDGLVGFQFTELDKNEVMVPARVRSEYLPIYYAEPLEGNQSVMGFDLSSEHIRRELLQEAGRTGRAILSQGIKLVQEQGSHQDGLIIVKPVYQMQPDKSLYGQPSSYVLVILRMMTLIEAAFENERSHHMEITVNDVTDQSNKNSLYTYGGGNRQRWSGFSNMDATATIHVGGRILEIHAIPLTGFILFRHWEVLFVLMTGCGLTFTFAGFLYLQRKREQIIEKKIEERTSQLSDVNEKLRSEIVLRRKTEELIRKQVYMAELISNAINRADEISAPDELMKLCLDVICRLTSWPIGFVYKISPSGGPDVSSSILQCDKPNNYAKLIEVCANKVNIDQEKTFRHVLSAKKPEWSRISLDNHSETRKQALLECEVKMSLVIPIVVFKNVPVVLEFFTNESISPDREMLLILQNFIEQIGHNIERKESEHKLRDEKERLQLFQNVTVTREMEIIELKKENNELHRRLGNIPPYDLSFLEKPFSSVKKLEAKDDSR